MCFVQSYITDIDIISNIEQSIENIKHCEWKNKCQTNLFWIEVSEFKDVVGNNPFIELSNFVLRLLSMPYSNADVERTFSVMNFYKSKIRNRLSLNSVNSLLHIKYGLSRHDKCCNNYDIPSSVCKAISSMDSYKKSKYFLNTVLWPNNIIEDESTDLEDIFFPEGSNDP